MPQHTVQHTRRKFLTRLFAGSAAVVLASCDKLSNSEWFTGVLNTGENLTKGVHHLVRSRLADNKSLLAQEFTEADLSPDFRSNGNSMPNSAEYQTLLANNFEHWALEVTGLVEKPMKFNMAQLQALPSRTQITRHDCVEGWSAIAKWKGTPLHEVLALVKPSANAKFAVFYCADPMEDDGSDLYYESIDMEDAYHPQTILAYQLNDETLPVKNGAPIRLRVERQLGYKQAKYIMKIALVEKFDDIAGGAGGYWEDQGYEWYAGI